MLYYCCCHHQFVVILICILYLVVVLIFFINIFIADSNNDYDADHLKNFDDDNYHSHNHHHHNHHNHYHEPHSPRDMKSTNPQKPSNQPQVETDFYYYFNHVFWFPSDFHSISISPNEFYLHTVHIYICAYMYVCIVCAQFGLLHFITAKVHCDCP